jgi:hypothetical protein
VGHLTPSPERCQNREWGTGESLKCRFSKTLPAVAFTTELCVKGTFLVTYFGSLLNVLVRLLLL